MFLYKNRNFPLIILNSKDQTLLQIMITSFSRFTPIKVKKISASFSGKVKKIEAQTKVDFLFKKRVPICESLLCGMPPYQSVCFQGNG